ncbi:hypothetical protein EHQ61_17445 [Leptospira wolffii]|uniref:hypothetical protein n=1 Tax=Leptospira wolffii TaxID=409998 RepID=UPI00108417C0|nr:hypothetical protein [Leptospira wolffii]TGL46528.1 hypothetical protein EHQ61_17445 [Leptospira wolffii]
MLILLLFLLILILLPAGISLDVWQYSKAGEKGFPFFWSIFSILLIFLISPIVSRFSSLATRWRKSWRFTAGIYEALFLLLSVGFCYLSQKESQLYKIAPEKFGEKDLWLLFSIYLGPFIFVFISAVVLWIYDFVKKQNGNYVLTKERTILYLVVSGCILLIPALQLHLRLTNPDFGEYQKAPETIQYPFYLVYAFLIYEWIRNLKSEGGKNGAMLFFACLIFTGIYFVLFPNILSVSLAVALLFSPIWIGKGRKTEFYVILFSFTVGVFLSRFISWRPEIFTKLEYYRFDHHISLLLLLLFGSEIRKSITEWPESKKGTIVKQILFYYRILVFAAFAVWASFYEFDEGVYTSQFGLLRSVSLHLFFFGMGYLLPSLWKNREQIVSAPKEWISKPYEAIPVGVLLFSLVAFFFGGARKISVDSSIIVGSQAQEIKNVLGPPIMENATTLKYYKVKTDNSPGADPEKSWEYLLEFRLSNARNCPEVPPGTVRNITVKLRTGYLSRPYGWIRSSKLDWFGVSGLDEKNLSTEKLGDLLTKINLPVYTDREDSNPTLGDWMYFNLPGKLKGEIVPAAFRYRDRFGEIALDEIYLGEGENEGCSINKTKRGVSNGILDPEILSRLEWNRSANYVVTENFSAKTKPEENSPNAYPLWKGMALTLQVRKKEPDKLGDKTGHWYYYQGAWIFDSVLKEANKLSDGDYAQLKEEDLEKNGISFDQWSYDVQESCASGGKKYEPKPGSLLWSLRNRYVILTLKLKTDPKEGYSTLGFSDFPAFKEDDLYYFPDDLRDFSNTIYHARVAKDDSPFSVKVKGELSLSSYCITVKDKESVSYQGETSVSFIANSTDFVSPKQQLISFGDFEGFRKEFFLSFPDLNSATDYCRRLGLSLVRKNELDRMYAQKDKFQLPMDSNYESQYWQADQAIETGASGSLLKAICVKR